MKTLIRIVCLGLCLSLAVPTAWGKTEDTGKNSSQSHSKSKSKSKSKSDSKSKGSKKNGSKSKGKGSRKDKGEPKKSRTKAASGEGFRGLAWGTPLSALKEPDLREEAGDLKYYTVPDEDMEVLGVHMREIVYVFCQDKLAGVLTRYDGQINQLALLGKLNDTFGTPLESPPNVHGDRSWRFDAGETSIMMEYSENASTGALAWMAKEHLGPCQQPGVQ